MTGHRISQECHDLENAISSARAGYPFSSLYCRSEAERHYREHPSPFTPRGIKKYLLPRMQWSGVRYLTLDQPLLRKYSCELARLTCLDNVHSKKFYHVFEQTRNF